jgi:hypothetical protein
MADSPGTSGAARRVLALLAAAASASAAVAGFFIASQHPLAPVLIVTTLAFWVAATWRWPWLPLFALPALLPAIDLAPWTGWLAIEEFDLLALGAMAGGYARMAVSLSTTRAQEPTADPFALSAWPVVALYALSQGIAFYRGTADAGGFTFGLTQGYDGPMNSLRIAKSLLLVVGMFPLVASVWRRTPEVAQRALVAGLVSGLVAASLAVVWERFVFTDLINFSTDYRTTALFWEMHVGGAALDGFIAVTLPFAVWALYAVRQAAVRTALLGALALAAYSALTTFSRGVYLATVVSLGILAILVVRQQSVAARRYALERFAVNGVVALATGVGAHFVFRGGGYRALGAMVVVAALALATVPVAWRMDARARARALAAGVLAGALAWALAKFLPKGPYVMFAVLAAVAVAAFVRSGRSEAVSSKALAVSAYAATLLGVVSIAWHWGGEPAGRDAAVVAAIVAGLWLFAASRDRPGWPRSTSELGHSWLAMVLAAGVVAAFSAGAYMGDRFATAERDLRDRVQHWHKGLDLLGSPGDWILGRGLGRFPATNFFGSAEGVVPGGYSVSGDGPGKALKLSSPSYSISFGDAFRISQRISPAPGVHALRLDVRTKHRINLHVEICEKHLLYSARCTTAARTIDADEQVWQPVVLSLDVDRLSRPTWSVPRLQVFSVYLETSARAVEIDNMSLIGPDGRETLRNGDFSEGMAHWFFTSDRVHLPWHIKNLMLNVLFEQGVTGLTAFLVLVVVALWRLVAGSARTHPLAPALAASILGFLVVGAFDSLLDVPRVAFLFYLLLLISLAIRPAGAGMRPQQD